MPSPDDKKKHLEFILQIITRMGTNSFLLKGWTVTLSAALIALILKEQINFGAIIGLIAGYLFWLLDSYYLSLERKYRRLYDNVRVDDQKDFQYTLEIKDIKDKDCSMFNAFISLNLLLFYGVILLINILLLILQK